MRKNHGIATVATKMLHDLNRRFKFANDPEASNFDAVYVTSTLLNPPYRRQLDSTQALEAKKFLLALMKRDENTHEVDTGMDNDKDITVEREEPPTKRFKHLDRVSKLLEEQETENDDEHDSEAS